GRPSETDLTPLNEIPQDFAEYLRRMESSKLEAGIESKDDNQIDNQNIFNEGSCRSDSCGFDQQN
ncbi:hypothetical protein MKW92_018319, partial [Papaver armeniacum]